jgi:hypothetical protein
MRQFKLFLLSFLVLLVPGACSGNALVTQVLRAEQVDSLMQDAMTRGLIAGGVVLVGTSKGIIFEKPYGRVA